MRSIVVGVLVLAVTGIATASHGPVEDTLTVEIGMEAFREDFYAVHPEAGVVTFVAAYRNVPRNRSDGYRREPAMYGKPHSSGGRPWRGMTEACAV